MIGSESLTRYSRRIPMPLERTKRLWQRLRQQWQTQK